ncbi:hypothetical protein BHE74_00013631 [Ensete ventricosum]|nr:hypothetical protein BHE74_00013631 [Ensete ventricosum]RZR81447.1 hypothetical protein BHM03_00007673 [Ensete ventricosum]
MLRSVLRSSTAAAVGRASSLLPDLLFPAASSRAYARAKTKTKTKTKAKTQTTTKGKKSRSVSSDESAARPDDASNAFDGIDIEFERPTDPLPPTYDPALDVGPGGRPLFAFTKSFASLTRKEPTSYVDFRC